MTTTIMVTHFIGRKFRKLKGKFTKKAYYRLGTTLKPTYFVFSEIKQVLDRFLQDSCV